MLWFFGSKQERREDVRVFSSVLCGFFGSKREEDVRVFFSLAKFFSKSRLLKMAMALGGWAARRAARISLCLRYNGYYSVEALNYYSVVMFFTDGVAR